MAKKGKGFLGIKLGPSDNSYRNTAMGRVGTAKAKAKAAPAAETTTVRRSAKAAPAKAAAPKQVRPKARPATAAPSTKVVGGGDDAPIPKPANSGVTPVKARPHQSGTVSRANTDIDSIDKARTRKAAKAKVAAGAASKPSSVSPVSWKAPASAGTNRAKTRPPLSFSGNNPKMPTTTQHRVFYGLTTPDGAPRKR